MSSSIANGRGGPLAGCRVLDLTTMVMGPLCTQILGDLGADVIKIERPEGDPQRYPLPSRHPTMNGVFLNLNRNKRSIAVDLKTAEGADFVLGLCREADVVVSSIRPGAAKRLGLDYDSVQKIKPDIVFCGAYGFGEAGPYRGKAAYDDVIQACSGIAGLLQLARGTPAYLPIALCDKISGLTMVYAIVAALFHREKTGEGQLVETPMFETSVAFNLLEHVCGFVFEPPLGEFGWSRILSEYRRPFATRDGHACIMPYSDKNWADFFVEIGRPELADDPRFRTHALRIKHIDVLYPIIEEYAAKRTTAEWMAFCDRAGIAAMPVIEPQALWDDPHVRAAGLLGVAEHPTEGTYRTIGSPVIFHKTPTSIRKHAPNLGEDTVSVMQEAGLSEAQIQFLLARGVLRQFAPAEERPDPASEAAPR
jgi:crotonobetainyl-CoA:carnitine CoA-transferase CaiB-like acyl-CoA transferase